jgi:hypothetical protein
LTGGDMSVTMAPLVGLSKSYLVRSLFLNTHVSTSVACNDKHATIEMHSHVLCLLSSWCFFIRSKASEGVKAKQRPTFAPATQFTSSG